MSDVLLDQQRIPEHCEGCPSFNCCQVKDRIDEDEVCPLNEIDNIDI